MVQLRYAVVFFSLSRFKLNLHTCFMLTKEVFQYEAGDKSIEEKLIVW